jgi:lipoate-protein ligase A
MKVSGNAQYVRQGRVMHHGTILFDSDMSVLGQALIPDPAKAQAKGVKSVRSRVTNVRPCLSRDMTIEEFRDALSSSLMTEGFERYELTESDISAIQTIADSRYRQWEWNYGYCEAGTVLRKRRIEGCGTVEAHITLKNDLLADIQFRGDYFSTLSPDELCKKLIGLPLNGGALTVALADCTPGDYITGLTAEELVSLLCD